MSSSPVDVNAASGFFVAIARVTTRFKWPVLIAYAVFLVLFGVIGTSVFSALNSEGFGDPGSDSARAAIILTDDFEARNPAVVLGVETATAMDSPESVAAAEQYIKGIAGIDGVENIVSYWTSGQPEQLRGNDDRTGQVLIYAEEDADLITLGETITSEFSGDQGEVIVYPFGGAVIGNEFTSTITGDLARAEAIAIPITIVLLLFVFGSVVSAGLPFLVAAGSILGSFFVLFIITKFTDGSVFALNLITGLGLALGIDYSLLMINRFREELARGASTDDAVFTTVRTAGKTVMVSGVTVAITLASLLFFPQFFLKSFAYAGISVSLLAVVGSLTALPAMLAILGPRVNKWKVRRGDLAPKDSGAWANIARFVMKRPWPVLIATIAVLLVVASTSAMAVIPLVSGVLARRFDPAPMIPPAIGPMPISPAIWLTMAATVAASTIALWLVEWRSAHRSGAEVLRG
jgi:RND superfamily putative drug exporter